MSVRQLLPLVLLGVLAAAPCFAAQPRAGQAEIAEPATTAAASAKSAAVEPGVPTVTFRKIFKGSTPEYVEIKVDQKGAATYDIRQIDDMSKPQSFQVSPALTAKIFSLAASLHNFDGLQLNARRRIANLGEKTFGFESNGQTYAAKFNYTTNSQANQLLGIFEQLSLEDQYLDQLKGSMRYDPLGLNDVLIRLQSDLASKSVAEPEALAPLLEKIVSDQRFLDIARARARQVLDSIGKSQ